MSHETELEEFLYVFIHRQAETYNIYHRPLIQNWLAVIMLAYVSLYILLEI